ncbi:hypothetical protein B0T22DRAFT_148725 [Podospora appendiculata]|uniref:Uncharacterized protein n=1 Tax=Podospora appendiculata TaxID=314037 RepID=A0AAE0X8W6_9PEZI|nr:hypothetical protein B0T22DRAFT_148725 [Podospora appendiculata]
MMPNVRRLANDQWHYRDFRPSGMQVMHRDQINNPLGQDPGASSARRGYQGNPNLPQNQSANIPDSENCSFFITNLPPDVTIPELLGHIRNCGRVYATHLNPSNPQLNLFHSAAKLVFFELAGARRFLAQFTGPGRALVIRDLRAKIVRNRVRVAESTHEPNCSRVLIVAGPPQVLTLDRVLNLFDKFSSFDTDSFCEERSPNLLPWAPVEWRKLVLAFGSFRSQSQQAMQAIRHKPYEFAGVVVGWGYDPCDIDHPGRNPNNPPMLLVMPRQQPRLQQLPHQQPPQQPPQQLQGPNMPPQQYRSQQHLSRDQQEQQEEQQQQRPQQQQPPRQYHQQPTGQQHWHRSRNASQHPPQHPPHHNQQYRPQQPPRYPQQQAQQPRNPSGAAPQRHPSQRHPQRHQQQPPNREY